MSYRDELNATGGALDAALASFDDDKLARVREVLRGHSITAVGSGGTLAVAELAALAHRHVVGSLAETSTPLRYAESKVHAEVAVFFSARAKHPDTAFAIKHAIAGGREVILITQRRADELPPALTHPRITVATVPTANHPDGFLATTSIASMAGAIAQIYDLAPLTHRAHASESRPADLDGLRQNVLVLHSEIGLPAARDIETRLHELGLADVQLTDYRNFGHGRHVGLARNSEITTVIALIGPPASAIAERTLAVLPVDTDVRVIDTAFASLPGATSLLLRVMPTPEGPAKLANVDPSKPKVAPFGRRLYHLPSARVLPTRPVGPVERKLAAAGLPPDAEDFHQIYSDGFAVWRRAIQRETFGGVLLDYDGTCVTTSGRFRLPELGFQRAMIHALDTGLRIGFASGRGKSLYNDLRVWLPEIHWPAVSLALHNGTWFQPLDKPLAKPEIAALTIEVQEAVRYLETAGAVTLEASGAQLLVSATRSAMTSSALRTVIESALPHDLQTRVRVVSSAHSVDVIPATAGKRAAMEHLETEWGQLYVVGDRGEPGGNDFDLLDSREWTMTVDRCSARADRCWPVTMASEIGPQGVSSILEGSHRTRDGVRLKLPTLPRTKR